MEAYRHGVIRLEEVRTPVLELDLVLLIFFSTNLAFAALKSDGSVQVWGHSSYGGDDPGIGAGSGVTTIFSTDGAFAALKTDGSVTTWGAVLNGGNAPAGLSGVSTIFSNQYAFVAITNPSLAYGPLVAGTGDSYSRTITGSICAACTNSGTNAGGKVDSGLVCVYPDCQTDQYSTGNGQCLTCPVGRFMATPINPSTVAECSCVADQYVSPTAYVASSNKYEGTSCSDNSDCETKCTADSACVGFTNNGGGV